MCMIVDLFIALTRCYHFTVNSKERNLTNGFIFLYIFIGLLFLAQLIWVLIKIENRRIKRLKVKRDYANRYKQKVSTVNQI